MKIIFFVSYIIALTCTSCVKVDKNMFVDQTQYNFPVLKLKEQNHVLHLDFVKADSTKSVNLKEVVIRITGTLNASDITSVAMYKQEGKGDFLSNKSVLFSQTESILSTVRLQGDMQLTGYHNYFWLSYVLKDDADISGSVGAKCIKVVTTDGKAEVSELQEQKPLRLGVAVRKHKDDGVHTYRIPGLVTTNKGSLLAVYDVRRESSRDLQGDIDIGISRSTDSGNSWEPMQVAMDMGGFDNLPQKYNGVSDACLLVDTNSDNIFVAALWMHGVINKEGKWVEGLTKDSLQWNHQWRNKGSQSGHGLKETSQFLIAKSSDDGKTWGDPINLTKMCKKKEWWLWAPAPGNGITMKNGTLVLPTQGRDENGLPFSNITFSKDGGVTWKTSEPAYDNTTECAVVQLDDGSLMLNMRDNRNRKEKGEQNGRAIVISTDFGLHWKEHSTSHNALIEPVCMASLYKHNYVGKKGYKKSVLVFSNPNSKENRDKQTLKFSFDSGKTWPEKYWILLDEKAGYSSLTSVDNETIGILYEGSQAQITFQKISIKAILGNNGNL